LFHFWQVDGLAVLSSLHYHTKTSSLIMPLFSCNPQETFHVSNAVKVKHVELLYKRSVFLIIIKS